MRTPSSEAVCEAERAKALREFPAEGAADALAALVGRAVLAVVVPLGPAAFPADVADSLAVRRVGAVDKAAFRVAHPAGSRAAGVDKAAFRVVAAVSPAVRRVASRAVRLPVRQPPR